MITEIITTGTELLLGEIVNENAQWAQLWEILQRKPELTHWGFHSC